MEATCPICQQEFSPDGRQRFCSNKCRQKHFYAAFKSRNGITYKTRPRPPAPPPPRYKPGLRTRLVGGVLKRNGHYLAHIGVANEIRQKRFSIAKLGEQGARLAASLQRMAWVIEMGVWNPRDGDPFEMLRYADIFGGNAEYENAVVDGEDSPWLHKPL